MRKFSIIVWLGMAVLAGCGGTSKSITGQTSTTTGSTGSTTTGSTGTATVTPVVAAVTLTTSSPSILSDGSTTATITALVRDASNNLVAGVPVKFIATSGGVAVTQATTDATGSALATLSTAGDPSLRAITVTATASAKSATVAVQVVTGTSSTTVQMGSPAGTNFKASVIGISSTNLSAGGSASLTVALQQSDGSLYTQPATITFSSTCAAQGLAKITSPSSTTVGQATTSTGVATATYVASGCSGADVINALATVGTDSLSATGSVTVVAASIGSIVYKSATYTIISLKGSGTAASPETSTVVFQVLDQTGGPRAGASVTFALDTSVGGVNLSTLGPVTSDANGNVQTTVQAGTVATPVRVTATVASTTPSISTQSSQLSVSTGVPTQNAFSVAVSCPNVEALNIDGVQVKVTARLADRFNNPVADGTAVQFNTEGGHIQPQCTTATTSTEAGVCSVEWTSANPRPTIGTLGRAGRSTLIATAIGEESFIDANGNGAFDAGTETWTDLPERFRDDNGNGIHDPGEYFYDFNNDGVYNPKDGLFNGVLCNDDGVMPSVCDSTKSSTGIGINSLIIMSGSVPTNLAPASGSTLGNASMAKGSVTYLFTVADVNNNPMPAGTTVKATLTGTGLTLSLPTSGSYTYPCTTEPLTYAFTVTVGSTALPGSNGSLLLDVTTPGVSAQSVGGIDTTASYSIPITN
jgi:hypothetical protein